MAVKDSITTADYIPFERATVVAQRLLKNKKTEILGRYIIVAINTGLRNSDIVRFQFEDIKTGKLTFRELKTGKMKTIVFNDNIKAIIPEGATGDMYISQRGNNISIQHLNRELKKVFSKEAKNGNISTHSLRKSFGRRVYEMNNESEKALMYLTELFNHTSMGVTRRYLGLKQEELNDIYMSL